MLDAVLEYELVGARFRPIVRLITAERVAHRLERAAHTDLFPGWPAIGADQLLALARDVGRWACLERLWQKASIEAVARRGTRGVPVLMPVDPVAFDAGWRPHQLAKLARAHGMLESVVPLLDLEDARVDVARAEELAAELRIAGFRIAARASRSGDLWRAAKPHWLVVGVDAIDRAALLAAEAFVGDARVLVDDARALRQVEQVVRAGVGLAAGPAFGAPTERPEPLDPSFSAGLARKVDGWLLTEPTAPHPAVPASFWDSRVPTPAHGLPA
ncbi:MAG TPA: hypothetical protein RMH85_04335 [Polyangiaceae bacterium LLY-WYZ-15_(1-7)]|nr:hypothetical protein [Myxococcales bacterium]MAT29383.1 hypothetical protein [Sandaracinus sp.]HJK92005.1 hypothetical protein [Polyangiaceae bacterium LLY-WYZ-15_(1-7)]HJL01382.1 hypothetical protein [Polyangiaceae bacterium LLY-WYZ-15_(1-7)]HJL07697.1 hypothetical protein [Polyangiaceae bacterium LLY-WYZ-15_(1-7)]